MAQIEFIARGIARHRGKILLCGHATKNYWYLPGGHIEPHESAADALAREFLEEAGQVVRVGKCVAIAEHIFRQGRKVRHEVNLVFHVKLFDTKVESQEPQIAFNWFAKSQLSAIDLRPREVAELLANPGDSIRHFMWNSDQS